MNGNKLAALAFAASLAATTLPTFAGTTGTVTVKWNTQTLSNITLITQYSNTGTHLTTADTILANLNGGTGICQASDTEASTGTVNFGNVTPDGVQYTDCMEENAVNALVTTNDTNGYNVKVAATAGYVAANGGLCLLPNGTYANNLAVTQTARAAAPSIVSNTACPAGDFLIDTTGSTILATTASTTGTNLGADYELVLPPNAPSGGALGFTVTETYTLTAL